MNFGILKKSWQGTVKENSRLWLVIFVLAASNLVLAYSSSQKHERVTIVPPHSTGKLTVDWDGASREYYESFAYYLSGLIGGLTPKNVDFVISALKLYLDTDIYIQVQQQLLSISKEYAFRNSHSVAWFEPDRVQFEKEANKFFTIGSLKSASISGRPGDSQAVIYEFVFEIREGKPVVTHFTSYEGSTPHTLKWQEEQKNRQQKTDAEPQKS